MIITAKDLASKVNGIVIGDPKKSVVGPERIESATSHHLTFLSNPKYEKYLYQMQPGIVLVGKDFKPKEKLSSTLVQVINVPEAVQTLLLFFERMSKPSKVPDKGDYIVHPTALIGEEVTIGALTFVGRNAHIGRESQIYPQVYIGNDVSIGSNTLIYPGVRIYDGTVIGDHCIIHANAVIGSDGFGYTQSEDGKFVKIPHLGNVLIENEVEIGANTAIDRAVMGSTIIKSGTKLDNLVHIGHNVEVGNDTGIAALAGVAGSVKIGDGCMIGGQVGINGHVEVADKTMIQAKSGIMSSIKKANGKYMGAPAMPYFNFLKSYAIFRDLPKIRKELYAIKKSLGL